MEFIISWTLENVVDYMYLCLQYNFVLFQILMGAIEFIEFRINCDYKENRVQWVYAHINL